MAQISSEVTSVVEKTSYSDDEKQDFYVTWLEMPEPHLRAEQMPHYIKATMANMARNKHWINRNRKRLLDANKDKVRRELGLEGTSDNPQDIAMSDEGAEEKLKLLTDLQLGTLMKVCVIGMTYAELAEWEGTTENVIYQRIHQAKKLLQGDTT